MSAQSPPPGLSLQESSYGMGWFRAQLPNILWKLSPNHTLLGGEPPFGDTITPMLAISRRGSIPGARSAVCIFPHTETVTIILGNTLPLHDPCDWIMQLPLQTIFEFAIKHDHLQWTKKAVQAEPRWYESLREQLESKRVKHISPRDLEAFVGYFTKGTGLLTIKVSVKAERLHMAFHGRDDESLKLDHHDCDRFCCLQPPNDLVSRERMVIQHAEYYRFDFEAQTDDRINKLTSMHDPEWIVGETFFKGITSKERSESHNSVS
ncbi:MAG: hypothetical protein M1828_004616 [Chrysothrix sp. TS-e1954]|nr:MAG: hypothetical protein M1828_004616 [Chrysothrix sp. TS-e1954]